MYKELFNDLNKAEIQRLIHFAFKDALNFILLPVHEEC
jgi:hypothetical protein